MLDVSIKGARGVLFNVVGGKNLGIHEVNEAATVIQEVVHPDAEIVFGAAIDESLGDEVKVTVIATGFETRPMQYSAAQEDAEQEPADDGYQDEPRPSRGLFGTVPEVDTELPAFLRRGVTAR